MSVGDASPMKWVSRFTRTERLAHWLVALAFGVMLFSGGKVPHHWAWTTLWLDVHLGAAIVLVAGLAGCCCLAIGTRSAKPLPTLVNSMPNTGWLSPMRIVKGEPGPPVGRFNGGQKSGDPGRRLPENQRGLPISAFHG